jgi:hypothetical protein
MTIGPHRHGRDNSREPMDGFAEVLLGLRFLMIRATVPHGKGDRSIIAMPSVP